MARAFPLGMKLDTYIKGIACNHSTVDSPLEILVNE